MFFSCILITNMYTLISQVVDTVNVRTQSKRLGYITTSLLLLSQYFIPLRIKQIKRYNKQVKNLNNQNCFWLRWYLIALEVETGKHSRKRFWDGKKRRRFTLWFARYPQVETLKSQYLWLVILFFYNIIN